MTFAFERVGGTPIFQSAGTLTASVEQCIIANAWTKRQGLDGERSERTAPLGASVHMPGKRNGSIVSLVNRAVKSNIFMNE